VSKREGDALALVLSAALRAPARQQRALSQRLAHVSSNQVGSATVVVDFTSLLDQPTGARVGYVLDLVAGIIARFDNEWEARIVFVNRSPNLASMEPELIARVKQITNSEAKVAAFFVGHEAMATRGPTPFNTHVLNQLGWNESELTGPLYLLSNDLTQAMGAQSQVVRVQGNLLMVGITVASYAKFRYPVGALGSLSQMFENFGFPLVNRLKNKRLATLLTLVSA